MVHTNLVTSLTALLFGATSLRCGAIDRGIWGQVSGTQWPNGFTPADSAYAWDEDNVTVYAYRGSDSSVIGLNLLTGASKSWLASELAVGAPVPEKRITYGRDSGAPFVFNPLLQRCILFGGMGTTPTVNTAGLPLGDTWLFDPSDPKKPWTQLGNGVLSPSPRWRSAGAVDESGVFYLFGGYDQNQIYGDFWSLTLTQGATGSITGTWSQAPSGPPKRFNSGMAASGSRLFVFGGWGQDAGAAVQDLWMYDTKFQAWGQISQSSPLPGPRYTIGMAPNLAVYGPTSEILVGPGCVDNDCSTFELNLWDIVKNTPTKLVTNTDPGSGVVASARSAMFVSQKQARLYLFQGTAAYYWQLATASCATAVACPSGTDHVASPTGTELNFDECCGAITTTTTTTSSTRSTTMPCPTDTTPCSTDKDGAEKAEPCDDFEVTNKDLATSVIYTQHSIGLVVGGAVVAISIGALLLVVATTQGQPRASAGEGHVVLMQTGATSEAQLRDAEENVFLQESASEQEVVRRRCGGRAAMVGGAAALAAVLITALMATGNGLRGQVTKVESNSDVQKLGLYDKDEEPCESTIAPCSTVSSTTSSTTSTSTTTLCPVATGPIVNPGRFDHYRGWYDTHGAGCCNDYCRWVGDVDGGDPSQRTSVATEGGVGTWSCRLAGQTQDQTPAGRFGPTFTFKKCGMPCLPALDLTAYANTEDPKPDLGYVDKYRGWYDTQGSGCCNDFCRWVGGATLPNPDPTVNGPVYTNDGTSFFSCLLAGGAQPPVNTPKDYFTTFPFKKCSTPCLPATNAIGDPGYSDDFRGWYDVQGSGCCNDYCRWVGAAAGGDPSVRTTFNGGTWKCIMAGRELNLFVELGPGEGFFGATFPFKKCQGKGHSG